MTKSKKRMAVAAIAAVGCLAGVLGLRAPESESQSALTLANIEALADPESEDNRPKAKCEGNCCICAKADDGSFIIHGHPKFVK